MADFRKVFMFTWNANSEGGRNLARAIGIRRVKHKGGGYRHTPDKVLINWGASTLPNFIAGRGTVLNPPGAVQRAVNKLSAFLTMEAEGVRVPPFTDHRDTAFDWLFGEIDVCARTKLDGSGGDGLVLVKSQPDITGDALPFAPLYTQYVKKKDEYRVHICGGEIIALQRKAARREFEGEVNWQIRSHDNGFVFVHIPPEEWDTVPADVLRQASNGFSALKLDFGAVDVIWNNHQRQAYVLEVNTAPGLEGRTIDLYAAGFRRYIETL